eukprot:scaffold51757_cov42-Cyclotella_meneghiniana.AAC.11
MSLFDGAKATVQRANLFNSADYDGSKRASSVTFNKTCPLVWDTGASFGLTPFYGDFIDYTECSITINDIARSNQVVDVGTTLHKFKHNGSYIFIPCLSYHLPSANIRLFSPQTYHTIYGGHSTVNGDRVEQYIDHLRIRVDIDNNGSNVPMIYGCHVSPQEMKEHGPHIRSALPSYLRKTDALGSFSEVASNFGYGLPGVGVPDNTNLSSARKELLLWHWKLGVSMQQDQQLMRVAELRESSGAVTTMDRVIIPKIKSAANCPIPMCQSCQLSRAHLRKPKVVKSKAIPDNAGVLSREQYCTGDFVSRINTSLKLLVVFQLVMARRAIQICSKFQVGRLMEHRVPFPGCMYRVQFPQAGSHWAARNSVNTILFF